MNDAFQALDQQIFHYLKMVRNLRTTRNTLPPISRLPPEILCQIFRLVRGGYHYGIYDNDRFWASTSYSEHDHLQWISVSHVCRHWRDVAMNDAYLWTDPPLKSAQWTMTMLERSREATIPAITLNIDGLDENVVNALISHMARISYLVVPRMNPDNLKASLTRLPREAPKLEALSINSLDKLEYNTRRTLYCISSDPVDHAVTIPEHCLCYTPNLRRLQLNGIIINWHSSLLSHLTYLSITHIPDNAKPTPEQFKTMLESAPALKMLHLNDVCPSPGRNNPKNQAISVLMQHLEFLTIEGTAVQLSFFFGILAAPALKGLTVYTNLDHHFVSGFADTLSVMNQPYMSRIIGSETDVRRLELAEEEGRLYIQVSQIPASERHLQPSDRTMTAGYNPHALTFWIDSGFEDDEESMDEIRSIVLPALFDNFDWTGLSELDLEDLGPVSPCKLASTFGALPQLRIVNSGPGSAPSLITAMVLAPDGLPKGDNPSRSTFSSFAGLRHLFIGYNSNNEHIKDLGKSLEQRHRSGIPVTSVTFNSNVTKTHVGFLFEEYVRHIVSKPSSHEEGVIDGYSPYDSDWYV